LKGTKVKNERFSPRWSKFTVKSENDVGNAVEILTEAHKRIKEALKAGEPTCYFSGGESSAGTAGNGEDDGEQEGEAVAPTDKK